jgi:deaminated glutathione amidase
MSPVDPANRSRVVVGAAQLTSGSDLEQNLTLCAELVALARSRGAELVVLPENFAFMGSEQDKLRIAEDLEGTGPIMRMLREAARTSSAWIIAGGMPERSADPARPYNACVAIDPSGGVRAVYRKIHLFDVEVGDGQTYRESSSTSAGADPVLLEALGRLVGLSVCYDLRFPELYRRLAAMGAEVLVVPAAFTLMTGKDHWKVLLRARAIENQSWVVAAAQWGEHPGGRRTFGKSCIIDPWGEIVAQASEGVGVVVAEIDPAITERVRSSLPALRHRKL